MIKYSNINKYIFACFIDLKKAFDTVNQNALLHKIVQYNIRGNVFSVLENMYKKVSFSVDLPDGMTTVSWRFIWRNREKSV